MVKKVQKLLYSLISNILSCKDFLYNLSKDFIVCWSLSYSFLYLLYLFMINSHKTLLPIDNTQADAVDNGITIKPVLVRDNVIELEVVAKKNK